MYTAFNILKIAFSIVAGAMILVLLAWFILAVYHFIKIYYDAYKANTKR